jgi:hypothetical protein
VVAALRALENNAEFVAEWESDGVAAAAQSAEGGGGDGSSGDGTGYTPARVGGINRLLMKLDFGSWFGETVDENAV